MAKAMTKTQIEHVRNRLERAISTAVFNYKKSLPHPERLPRFSNEEQWKQVLSGKAKINKEYKGTPYYMENAFIFPQREKEEKAYKDAMDAIEAKVLAYEQPLRDELASIMDTTILSGSEEALVAMQSFMKKLEG